MKKLFFLFLYLNCYFGYSQKTIDLYPSGQILFANTGSEIPQLTVFEPKEKKSDIVVIVCSGGSYGGRANDVEGFPACKMLNDNGITAFLLDYRVPNASKMQNKKFVPLTDVQKAIHYVRTHAEDYGVAPDKLGVMGFSAGGHLVTTAGTHFDTTKIPDAQETNLRPDFVVAVYPVVSFSDALTHWNSRNNLIGPTFSEEDITFFSNEKQVTDKTPAMYLVSAIDDDVVKVENSLQLEAALRQHEIPVEIYLYANGGHGFGVDNKTAQKQWTKPCIQWILGEQWNK